MFKRPIVIAGFGASSMRGWRPGVHNYQTYRSLFERGLCDEGIPSVIIDAAQPGNTTLGGMQRFERDILLLKPDAVLISFALNDSSFLQDGITPRVTLETYRAIYEYWITALKALKIPIILMIPQPFAPKEVAARNESLEGYANVMRALAEEHDLPLADIFRNMQDLAAGGRDLGNLYLDHVHLNPEGNQVVAEFLLNFERATGVLRSISEKI